MISSIIQAPKIQPNMSEKEKKQQRIYYFLNVQTKPKRISEIIGVSLWPPSSPDLNPLDYSMGRFKKQNKCILLSKDCY